MTNDIAPRTDRPIVLTGPMGSGKSTLAPLLAGRLGVSVRETDSIVEAMAGLPIPRIFSELGQSRFRALESEALVEALRSGPAVIATGGATLCRAAAWKAVRSAGALSVLLTAPVETLASRLGDGRRPLLASARDEAERVELLSGLNAERERWYRLRDIELCSAGTAEQVAAELEEAVLRALERSVPLGLGEESHSYWLADGLGDLGERMARVLPPEGAARRCSLVTDEQVGALYETEARATLEAAGYEVVSARFPAGEGSKTLETAAMLIDRMLEGGHQRGSPVVALGGGVTGDIAGFAAALLHRGCPVVQVPTTLLAMVDSSIGGKTAVNHPSGKNLIGAFHQPALVHAPLCTLRTLERRHYLSGLAEVIKTALLEPGHGLLEVLEKESGALSRGERSSLLSVIARTVRLKASVVEEDPRERLGRRRILNLGHTLGHALEAEGRGRWTHGEAVGLGLLAAARVGAAMGLALPALEERIRSLLQAVGLPSDLSPILSREVFSRVARDKKTEGSKTRFVVPVTEGGVEIVSLSATDLEFYLQSSTRGA